MNSWPALNQELDSWLQSGEVAKLWWRDDDADEPGRELQQLVALSRDHAVPIGLAVSPALVRPALPDFIAGCGCVVLQHGYAHINHAPPGQKKSELGGHRPVDGIVRELEAGYVMMWDRFSQYFLPVMVPPWNRISDKIFARLSSIGFIGISTYTPRHYSIEYGLRQCNTHLDVVDWRGQGGFIGVEPALQLLINHLTLKRSNRIDRNEPTGLLTHHQRHDEQTWRFLEELLARTSNHPAVQWLAPASLFEHGTV